MISKNTIKYIKSLHLKKFRQKYNKFIVEGDKIVREFLQQDRYSFDTLYATKTWIETNYELLKLYEGRYFDVKVAEMKKISTLNTPSPVLLIADYKSATVDLQLALQDWTLYLDGIQDPGNLGTILRIADWFGMAHVFRSPLSVDLYNPKVIQSSMGAFLRVDCPQLALEEIKKTVPQITLYGTFMEGENIFELGALPKGIIIIGNEGKGISVEVQSKIERRLSIPAEGKQGAESLNAAVATGIVCAVLRNQK